MSTDHKALAVIAAVAVMGVGVRLTREPISAAAVVGASEGGSGERRDAKRPAHGDAAPTQQPRKGRRSVKSSPTAPVQAGQTITPPAFGSDREGYVGSRLDLDGATLAQIESLPGIGPKLAARIVLDRAAHGPFLNKEGLGRVRGVGPVLLQRLDSLVTFSGRLTPLPDSAAASLKPDGLTSRSDSTRSRGGKPKKRSKKPRFS